MGSPLFCLHVHAYAIGTLHAPHHVVHVTFMNMNMLSNRRTGQPPAARSSARGQQRAACRRPPLRIADSGEWHRDTAAIARHAACVIYNVLFITQAAM